MDIPFLHAFLGTQEDIESFREQEDIPWIELSPFPPREKGYRTEIKIGYSTTELIVLMRCEDRLLRCTPRSDQGDLYLDDVFELFLQPCSEYPTYFEYQLSPLGAELALVVHQAKDGSFHGWSPWHYEGERRVKKELSVHGGEQTPGSIISGWNASISIPFALFKGLENVPPCPGTQWKGNFYRLDYDRGIMDKWMLFPVSEGQFHNFWEFGELRFV